MAMRFRMDEVAEAEEKLYIIPVNMIRGLPFNTSVIDKAIFEALQTDMSNSMEVGFTRIDPILVRRLTPEEIEEERKAGRNIQFEVVDGHKRLEAAENMGWTHIKARVINVSRDEAIIINYRKNKERGEIDEIKESLFFRYLHEDKGMDLSKIAGTFGLTEDVVKAIMMKAPVSREARRILLRCRKRIPPSVIEVISSAPEKIQAELAKAFAEGLSASKLEDLKSRLIREAGLSEPSKTVVAKPIGERIVKPTVEKSRVSVSKPPVERRLPEPVRKIDLPEPIKPALAEEKPKTVEEKPPLKEPLKVEVKPPEAPSEAVQEFTCPGCGRRLRVNWEKRIVEWI